MKDVLYLAGVMAMINKLNVYDIEGKALPPDADLLGKTIETRSLIYRPDFVYRLNQGEGFRFEKMFWGMPIP